MTSMVGSPGWRLSAYRDAGEATGTFEGLDHRQISGGGSGVARMIYLAGRPRKTVSGLLGPRCIGCAPTD